MNLFRRLFFIASISLAFCSCNKVGEGIFGDWWPYDRSDASSTSKGSTFKILQDKGNFTLFMSALDKAGYKGVVNGAGLVTVFAPTDEAFREFLSEKYGTVNLDEIAPEELELIVSFHLIKFSYSADDFIAFSVSSTSENPVPGNGSAYRYKTYARKPIQDVMDPITGKHFLVYHKEEWLPVISSRLFTAKGSPDPKKDYETMFPGGTWAGSGDHLYVANATVTESGIPTDNGYLYIIDKVVEPMPTIYEALSNGSEQLTHNYSLFTKLMQTLNSYVKDNDLTKTYAEPGENIYLQWMFAKPGDPNSGVDLNALPAVASEWAYNDEDGVNLTSSMSFAVTATIPTDEALSAWMQEYFADWFDPGETVSELIGRMPYIHLYQIAATHLFNKRDLIIPSQLTTYGVAGVYGELYNVSADKVVDNMYCANGMIYGIDTVLVSPLFDNSFVTPILKTPSNAQKLGYSYNWYMIAFMERQFYRTAIGSDESTLFLRNDDIQNASNYRYGGSVRPEGRFIPQLTQNAGNNNMNPDQIADYLNTTIVRGKVPDPKSTWTPGGPDYLRYYMVIKPFYNYTYIISYNGSFYTAAPTSGSNAFGGSNNNPQSIQVNVDESKTYNARNGVTYVVDKQFTTNPGGLGEAFTYFASAWRSQLAVPVGIAWPNSGWNGEYNSMNTLAFVFSDQAVEKGLASGFIPRYNQNDPNMTQEQKDQARKTLRDYLNYYIIDRSIIGLPSPPLPGLRPDGINTDEKYSYTWQTSVEFTNVQDAKYITVEWDPADPLVMTLVAQNGDRISTTRRTDPNFEGMPYLPFMSKETVLYVLDEVFNYRTMFGN